MGRVIRGIEYSAYAIFIITVISVFYVGMVGWIASPRAQDVHPLSVIEREDVLTVLKRCSANRDSVEYYTIIYNAYNLERLVEELDDINENLEGISSALRDVRDKLE